VVQTASTIQLLGAAGFGSIVGWYIYYINRYRKGSVQFSDLVTLIGIIGGGTVLTLFPASTDLFGAYGVGLMFGFFGYFASLCVMISISKNFDVDWFLDGRRSKLGDKYIPEGTMNTIVTMGSEGEGQKREGEGS
jgi:hypothetical protein